MPMGSAQAPRSIANPDDGVPRTCRPAILEILRSPIAALHASTLVPECCCVKNCTGGTVPETRRGYRDSKYDKEVSTMAKPAVVLIGADKGGVGKTTVSRTLLDYFLVHKIPTRVFDTEYPKCTLKRFHPEITEVVDITSVPAQMKIFDTIYSSGTQITLLDIRAGTLSSTLNTLRDIGFLEMARRNQIIFALFHILGPSIASLDEIAETSKILIEAQYFLVKNFINNAGFFDWDQATYNSYFKNLHHAGEITIQKLNEMACEQVELASVPFATFAAKTLKPESSSFVLRGYVR